MFDFRLQAFHAVAKRLNFTTPLAELKNMVNEIATTKPIVVYCAGDTEVVQAVRFLSQN